MRMRLAQVILGYSYRNDLDFVLQTEVPLLRTKTGEEDDEVLAYLDHVFQDAKREDYLKWVARRVKTFGLVGDWIAYCANQDIVVGSRLHGVIAGLLAGTPSILVTHDARTREMAEAAGIPNVSGEDVVTSGMLDPCAYLTEEAVRHFGARQMKYFAEFKAFRDRNGVPNVLSDLAGFPRPCRKHLA